MTDITLSEEQLRQIVRTAVAQAQEQALPHAKAIEQEFQTEETVDFASGGFATDFHDFSMDAALGGFELFSLDISSRKTEKKDAAPQPVTSECGIAALTPFPWKTLLLFLAVVIAVATISTTNTSTVAHNASTRHAVKQVSTVVASPGTGYSVLHGPSISAATIEHILCTNGSPACGTNASQAFYQGSVSSGIDDVVALAFFHHESSYGEAGWGKRNQAIGNIRCSAGYTCGGGYRAYSTWGEGVMDWYGLIHDLYVQGWGLTTVDQIIPRYAPPTDNNDDAAYIASVEHDMDAYRAEGGH